MHQLLLLGQLLLLLLGWFLLLRTQQAIRDEARKRSIAAEAGDLRRTIEGLLSKLIGESERAKRELDARIGLLKEAPQEARDEPPVRAFVYALADQGKRPEEIARQTGRPVGDVELILNVRGRTGD